MRKTLIAALCVSLLGGIAAAGQGRGYMGVSVVTVDNINEGAEENGVYIGTVHEGSGAEAAGLTQHDRILAVNGTAIVEMADLDGVLNSTTPGQSITVSIMRNGREQSLDLVLGHHLKRMATVREHKTDAHGKWVIERLHARPRMGVMLEPLGDQLASYFGVDSGLLVTSVVEDSAAWRAGLEAGDVLIDIGGESVSDVNGVHTILANHEAGDVVDVTVQRRGSIDRYSLTLEEIGSLSADDMTFNVALDGGHNMDVSGNLTIEIANPGHLEMHGQTVSLQILDDDDPVALQKRILHLQNELHSLQDKLHNHEKD